jgi:hypothetical protein
MNRIISLIVTISLMLLYATQGPAAAASGSFFEGKTIRFIASSSPGGGNDTYVRLFARFAFLQGICLGTSRETPKWSCKTCLGRAVW